MKMLSKVFTRRDERTELLLSRLDSVTSTYNVVSDADAVETLHRIRRLRYGTKGRKQGEPALNLGR